MSAVSPSNAASDFGPLFRLSVAQYHELGDAGILTEDDRVELLEGVLVQKMTKYPPHSGTVLRLQSILPALLPRGWHYRAQEPITLSDGEPEPDGVIARGAIDDYAAHHPYATDVSLVIEVADATLTRDRGIKLRSYARAGIPAYWIVNLVDLQVEVYGDPDPAAAAVPTYRRCEVIGLDGNLELRIGNDVLGKLQVSNLLPPQ